MAILVKIAGLRRGNTVRSDSTSPRGFRVKSGLGLQYPSGTKAFEIIGTVGAPNAAVQYTARYGGTYGNAVKVVQNAPSGSTRIITTAYAASTGAPTVTITPTTTDTAATLVAAFNQHPEASQYAVASLVGTGASAPVASADANAVVTLAQATGTSTGGTFTLTFPGFGTTAAIAYNATGAAVATAVQLVTGGTVTGSATTLPASTTLTFSGTLAATPIYNPTVDNTANTGGTYSATTTTYGRALAGTMAGGTNVGTGQAVLRGVTNQAIVVVDITDPATADSLRRNPKDWISLGLA
jgi:hypothetical protein